MKIYTTRAATRLLFSFFVLSTLLLSACSVPIMMGSRDVVTQEMEFEDFDEIEINGAFTVEIRQDDEFSVKFEIDEASLKALEVSKKGNLLTIGVRPSRGIFWNFDAVRRVEITMPSLEGMAVRNASSVDGEIDTGDLWLIVDNASDVTLVGKGNNVNLRVDNSSSVNLGDFAVEDANIIVGNASSVTVDVAGRLDAEAENASSIVYYGNPTLGNTHSSNASSITARQQ